ncbi:MAG: serine protease [Granulosicoccus sp.]
MNNISSRSKRRTHMMSIGIAIVALFATQSPRNAMAEGNQATPRIVGGTVVPDGRYPFMAAIYFDQDGDGNYFHACGGTIIAANWILTAAHCVVNPATGAISTASEVGVRVGINDLGSDAERGQFVRAAQILPYPAYDRETSQGDLALIRLQVSLSEPVIALPGGSSSMPLTGDSTIVAGWGRTTEDGDVSADLLEVPLSVVSHADCLPFYPQSLDTQANFCAGAGFAGGRDSCQGDSGGPLFLVRDDIYIQAGVVSYGEGCARPGIPGVYTRLSTYANWIASFAAKAVFVDSVVEQDGEDIGVRDDWPLIFASTPVAMLEGIVLQGQVRHYEVTGSTIVNLTTLSGDADLRIYGRSVRNENQICESRQSSDKDTCAFAASSDRLFATVYGFKDSSYRIAVNGAGPADDRVPSIDASASSSAGAVGYVLLTFMATMRLCRHRRAGRRWKT